MHDLLSTTEVKLFLYYCMLLEAYCHLSLRFDNVLFYLQTGYNFTQINSALYMMTSNGQNFKWVGKYHIYIKILLLLDDLLEV